MSFIRSVGTGNSSGSDLPLYGWQVTAANTGLARLGIDGNSLTTYTGASKPAANTTISLMKITYPELICSNGGITIDRCYFVPASSSNRGSILYGYDPDFGSASTGSTQLGSVTVQDCDFDASALTGDANLWGLCAVRGAITLLRTKMIGMGTGLGYFGSDHVSSDLVERCITSGLRAGGASHNEGGTVRGFTGTSLIIRKNYWLCDSATNQTAGFFLQTLQSDIQNCLLEDNFISATSNWDVQQDRHGDTTKTFSNLQVNNNRFANLSTGTWARDVGAPAPCPVIDVWTNNYVYDAASPPNCQGASVSAP
jgi:hypothetical protein